MLKEGKNPGELAPMLSNLASKPNVGPDGKPIPDAEGGVMIQPEKGFVFKTTAKKTT